MLFNAPNTPAFNIIETVFCDMKDFIRRKNKKSSRELVEEARNFLATKVDANLIKHKLSLSCKYFIMALNNEEF